MPSFTICALSCRQNEWSIFFELRALLTSNAIRNFLESSRFFFPGKLEDEQLETLFSEVVSTRLGKSSDLINVCLSMFKSMVLF